jgi:malonyl-CoA O-methyltransferase
MNAQRPPTIDLIAAERWAMHPTTSSPWLHEEVARRMAERLDLIRLQPQAWADWGAVRGGLVAHAALAERYPDAECYVVEETQAQGEVAAKALAGRWWKRWTVKSPHTELPSDGGVQMLWANMGLHMAADPEALIQKWHRALAKDGFLMFSCLGPDTLRELRQLYQARGWPVSGHTFTDMHDWGDMLVKSGFAEPVMDMERITLTYATPQKLLADMRELGRNLHPQRFAGLRTRAWRAELEAGLNRHLRPQNDANGPLSLTFEVIYGHAFKPKPRVRMGEHSAVSLEDMRVMLHTGRG